MSLNPNADQCPEREKQVNEQVQEIGKFIEEGGILLNKLYERLEVVLRSEIETNSEEIAKEDSEIVALAYALKCRADWIANQNSMLESILDRLEL